MAKTAVFDSSTIKVNPEVSAMPKGYENVQNPYTNLEYKQGWFDRLMGDLGFRTKADAFAENMQMQANEFQSNLALKAHDEEYNSPAAQAARLRAAGINPDLSDAVDAGSTPPMSEDTNPPTSMGADYENVASVAGSILKGVSMGIGFMKDLTSLEQMQAAIESNQIGNVQGLLDFANSTYGMMIPSDIMETGQLRTGWKRDVLLRGYDFASKLPRKLRNQYFDQLSLFVDSMDQQILAKKKVADNFTANADTFDAGSRAGAQGITEVTSDTAAIISGLAETGSLATKEQEVYEGIPTQSAELGARSAKAGYEQKYYDDLDPSQAAAAGNAQNEATEIESSRKSEIQRPIVKGLKSLAEKAKNGNPYANAALVGISVASASMPILGQCLRIAKISKVIRRK